MNWNQELMSQYKNGICIINFFIFLLALLIEGVELEVKIILGLFLGTIGGIFWNSWLYLEIFETERSQKIISYENFLLIGLLVVLGVFSGILAVLIEDIFRLDKTIKMRWLLMGLIFTITFFYIRRKASK